MISTRGSYALRMMLDLAQHQNEGYVPLSDIAERLHISKKYLEQIVPFLNRAGLLHTSRGAQGGYRLVKAPDEYTVFEILQKTHGSLAPVACLEYKPNRCKMCNDCPTLFVWEGLDAVTKTYLDGITLQDIIDGQAKNQPAE